MSFKTNSDIDMEMLDLYSDYLFSSFSLTTATGLSALLDNQISHDQITRFLSEREYNSKDLWMLVKPVVREIETDDGCLLFDDTIEEKEYTDENEIVAWHFDHSKGRNLKGVNILSAIYHNNGYTIPISFEIVKKDQEFIDDQGKKKRRSSINKNEYFRDMFKVSIGNKIKFKYVLADIWFSSKENMEYILENQKHFIFAVKKNRLVALSKEDKLKGKFKNLESLDFEEGQVKKVFFKGMEAEVLVCRQVFTNQDGSTGILYLATSDIDLDFKKLTDIYQKRWKIEEYHKSIKSNTSLAKSPTKTMLTQGNHFFASIYSFFKLEQLSHGTKLNHFALKTKLYVKALKVSFGELQLLKNQTILGVGA
jgi:hypothetical protein